MNQQDIALGAYKLLWKYIKIPIIYDKSMLELAVREREIAHKAPDYTHCTTRMDVVTTLATHLKENDFPQLRDECLITAGTLMLLATNLIATPLRRIIKDDDSNLTDNLARETIDSRFIQ